MMKKHKPCQHVRRVRTKRGKKRVIVNHGVVKRVRPVYVVKGEGKSFRAFYKAPGKKVVDVSNSFPLIVEDKNDGVFNSVVADKVAVISGNLDVLGVERGSGKGKYSLKIKKKGGLL